MNAMSMCIIVGWGQNNHGQVGVDSDELFITQPRRLRDLPCIAKVAAGDAHAVALSEGGEVFTWGSSKHGQTGHGQDLPRERGAPAARHDTIAALCVPGCTWPLRVRVMLRPCATLLAIPPRFAAWPKTLWQTDSSTAGLLFAGPRLLRAPRLLRGLAVGHEAIDVAAAGVHTLVATEAGGVWGFGSNRWRQLVGAAHPAHDTPVQVPINLLGGADCLVHHACDVCLKIFWSIACMCQANSRVQVDGYPHLQLHQQQLPAHRIRDTWLGMQ